MERVPDVLIGEFIKRSKFRDVKRLCSLNKRFKDICNHEPIKNIIDGLEINQSMSNQELRIAVRDYFRPETRAAILQQYGPIGEWNVSNVTDMSTLFLIKYQFNEPLNWNVSNVTDMERMFSFARSFNQPLNNWNVSNVTEMSGMFSRATSFNQPLNDWDVSNVTNMHGMFWFAGSFNQPLNWNVSNANTSVENLLRFSG